MAIDTSTHEKSAASKKVSRRRFFKRSGIVLGGALFGMYFGRDFLRRKVTEFVGDIDFPSGISNFNPDFWFEIMEDNTVLMKVAKVEMGQGVYTGHAMLAAEELEVPVEQIKVVPAPTSSGLVDMLGTGGSTSTASLFIPIRETAATMREMLKLAAAKHWDVDPAEVEAREGMLHAGEKHMSYADITQATSEWEIPKAPALKPSSNFKYVGTEMPRVDLEPKVMGEGIFGIDAAFPNMLYATILYSPYIGGSIKQVDLSDARATQGVVQIVEHEGWIGVVAESRYAAEMGKRQIKAEWDIPRTWQQTEIDALITVGKGTSVTVQKEGSIKNLDGEEVITAEYRTPLRSHAQIEPQGCVAHVEDDKATIYIGTQSVSPVLKAVADALDMKKDNIDIRLTFLGGGFGGRYFFNNAGEAAILSRAAGAPVHVFRTREDEFQSSYYKPNTHHQLRAELDAEGNVVAIDHQQATGDMFLESVGSVAVTLFGADTISAGHGARIMYSFDNKHAKVWQNKLPFPTGIWRGVGMVPNSFAIESFMDELAHKAGKDPLQFRIDNLTSNDPVIQRMSTVLKTLRDQSGWQTPKEEAVGRGVACAEDRKSLAAAMVEVKQVDGQIRVSRVVQVVDPGIVINPEGVRTQVEGATMMGISASLYEGLYVKDAQISASNFHQYPMAFLKDTPQSIEVILLNGANKPYGVGEPPIAPMAPAIANAIFDLTGERRRTLPLT